MRLHQFRIPSILALFLLISSESFAFGPGRDKVPPTSDPSPGEPEYCVHKNFSKHEVPYSQAGVERQHVYRFGDLHLVGVAVGNSETSGIKAMAADFTRAGTNEKFCTWYHNDGNSEAAKAFNYFPVDRPGSNADKSVEHYRTHLQGIFADNAVNMLDCAQEQGYVALGCDGMQHRGPTVFGMLLAYSGCTPEHAAELVNYVWGLNGVPEPSRLAVIREGQRLGQLNPGPSAKFRELFSR